MRRWERTVAEKATDSVYEDAVDVPAATVDASAPGDHVLCLLLPVLLQFCLDYDKLLVGVRRG